jgi:hypothetical protein
VREVVLEIPLSQVKFSDKISGFLEDLSRRVVSTDFFQVRSKGFLMICRVSSHSGLMDSRRADKYRGVQVKVLSRERSGAEVLQISGAWRSLFDAGAYDTNRLMRFMESASREPVYIANSPAIHGKTLRATILADEGAISKLFEEMRRAHIPFKVAGLSAQRTASRTPMANLTARQVTILRLAHSMGYFDIPKKAGVEDLARMVGINKGTVGEHLQKAEKRVFDQLL